MNSFRLQTVRIGKIIPDEDRPLDLGALRSLTKAIERDGIKRPLDVVRGRGLVRDKFILLDGRHRLEALKQLDKAEVLVRVMSRSDGRIWRNSADLHKRIPNVLERSERIARYSRSTPVARSIRGGIQPHDRSVKRIADSLGYSRKLVSEAFLHAELPEDLKELIRESPIANNRAKLTQLAKLGRDEQHGYLASLLQRKQMPSGKVAVNKAGGLKRLKQLWKKTMSEAYRRLSDSDKAAFAQMLSVKPPDSSAMFHDW